MYGTCSWKQDLDTSSNRQKKRVDAFELLRKILKTSWTDRVGNEEVLRRTNANEKEKKHIGHICRLESLLANILVVLWKEGTA